MAILFYRAKDPFGCLSNFSRHRIVIDGVTWPTTEHYYQAMKFLAPDQRARIRAARDPGDAKAMARENGARVRKDWYVVRDGVMLVALRAKFSQHADLRATLLETGSEELVEHSTKDPYWGDGGDGSGANTLGRLLMQVREELRGETGLALEVSRPGLGSTE